MRLASARPAPTTRRARRVVALAAIAAAGVAATLAPSRAPLDARAADGLTFTYRVKSSRPPQKGQPSTDMLATVSMLGPNARMDYRENAMPLAKDGGYVLIRGREGTFNIVNVKDRQVLVMDAEGLGSAFGALTNNALIKFAIKDPSFTYEDLGAGDRILGYPTRHVRVKWAATYDMRVLFSRTSTREESEAEYWLAMNPAGVDVDGLRAWSTGFGMGLRRTNRDMMAMMEDYQKKFGGGLALRMRTVMHSTDLRKKNDAGTVDTIVSEVEELKRGALSPATFEIPTGYEVVDMRAALAGAATATQQASESLKKAADSAEKENPGAKEQAKKALKGLFKRP